MTRQGVGLKERLPLPRIRTAAVLTHETDAGVRESREGRRQVPLEFGARDLAVLLEHDVHAASSDVNSLERALDTRIGSNQRGNSVSHRLGLLERAARRKGDGDP